MKLHLQKIILTRLLKLTFGHEMSYIVQHFLDTFNSLRKKSGLAYAIKYYKAVRLHCTRYICGQPLMANQDIRIGLIKGFPSRFYYLKDLIDTGKCHWVVLTLLT